MIYWKRKLISEKASRKHKIFFLFFIHGLFLFGGYYMGVVVKNFLVPFLRSVTLEIVVNVSIMLGFFLLLSLFTKNEMKQLLKN
jgi:hypothetical protein